MLLLLIIMLVSFSKFCASDTRATCQENFLKVLSEIKHVYGQHFPNLKSENSVLFLLHSSIDLEHADHLNYNFSEAVKKLHYFVEPILPFCDDQVLATEIVAKYFTNVINLWVKDIYVDEDRNPLPENLMYAGSSKVFEQKDKVITCTKTDSAVLDTETDYVYCDSLEKTVTNSHIAVKIISKPVKTHEKLFRYINIFNEDSEAMDAFERDILNLKDQYKNSIVICAKKYLWNTNRPHGFIVNGKVSLKYVDITQCHLPDFVDAPIFGIFTPKPIDTAKIFNIPAIFYDTPTVLPEYKYEYPNWVLIHEFYNEYMIESLMKILEINGWSRVAVISDSSPYSDIFESQLTTVFHEKNIVYVIKRCQERKCYFFEELKSLYQMHARIIFINVEGENAKRLVNAAQTLKIHSKQGIMWIWRSWPFTNDYETATMGDVYSLDITSGTPDREVAGINLVNEFNIIKGISAIEDVLEQYKDHIKDIDTMDKIYRDSFYRNVSSLLRSKLNGSTTSPSTDNKRYSAKAILRKVTPHESLISYVFTIQNHRIKNTVIASKLGYYDLDSSCAVRSYKFDAPCDDLLILIIMFAIFILCVSIICIYFCFKSVLMLRC